MISASSHNPRRARVVVGAHANGSALLIALAAVLLQTMMPPAMATTFNVSNTGGKLMVFGVQEHVEHQSGMCCGARGDQTLGF
jgi:hypothetical protein